MFSVLHTADQA